MPNKQVIKVNRYYKYQYMPPVWRYTTKEKFMYEEKLGEEDFEALFITNQIFLVGMDSTDCLKEIKNDISTSH